MNLIENIYELAESFMYQPKWVTINYDQIQSFSKTFTIKPELNLEKHKNKFKVVLLELVASSINYCYWYGKNNIRPNNNSSATLYENLYNSFFDYEHKFLDIKLFNQCLDRFIELLIVNRFPLIEERIDHLNQLREKGEFFANHILQNHNKININELMLTLITTFPGFSSDMFLKRASLFFIQLYRKLGWFKDQLHNFFVPADYQIPKMLNFFGCTTYNPILQEIIDGHYPILKHSIVECEIRSATIVTMKKIVELTGWNIADIDTYLFSQRHLVKSPFHLTVTTDY